MRRRAGAADKHRRKEYFQTASQATVRRRKSPATMPRVPVLGLRSATTRPKTRPGTMTGGTWEHASCAGFTRCRARRPQVAVAFACAFRWSALLAFAAARAFAASELPFLSNVLADSWKPKLSRTAMLAGSCTFQSDMRLDRLHL